MNIVSAVDQFKTKIAALVTASQLSVAVQRTYRPNEDLEDLTGPTIFVFLDSVDIPDDQTFAGADKTLKINACYCQRLNDTAIATLDSATSNAEAVFDALFALKGWVDPNGNQYRVSGLSINHFPDENNIGDNYFTADVTFEIDILKE